MDICVWCNNRTRRLIPKYYRVGYAEDSRSYQDTHIAAKRGCKICSLLCAGVTTAAGQLDAESCIIFTTLISSFDKHAFTIKFRYSQGLGQGLGNSKYRLSKSFEFCSPSGNKIWIHLSSISLNIIVFWVLYVSYWYTPKKPPVSWRLCAIHRRSWVPTQSSRRIRVPARTAFKHERRWMYLHDQRMAF